MEFKSKALTTIEKTQIARTNSPLGKHLNCSLGFIRCSNNPINFTARSISKECIYPVLIKNYVTRLVGHFVILNLEMSWEFNLDYVKV
ncbi:hypothetical protein hrd7_26700 [Leptolinea sp. HRD-7]|nr:hypothetical protein hrd7_26700 [Leptolinea sp. HRD-7]